MKNGAVEKDVVLAFSLRLKDKLEKTGRYKVMMTRDTDVFVPLDKRVDYAEDHKANLFIAVHADYAGEELEGARRHHLFAARIRRQCAAALGQGPGLECRPDEGRGREP